MAYTPYTWASGETIEAQKLNRMEAGIQEAMEKGGSGLPILNDQVSGLTYALVVENGIPMLVEVAGGGSDALEILDDDNGIV